MKRKNSFYLILCLIGVIFVAQNGQAKIATDERVDPFLNFGCEIPLSSSTGELIANEEKPGLYNLYTNAHIKDNFACKILFSLQIAENVFRAFPKGSLEMPKKEQVLSYEWKIRQIARMAPETLLEDRIYYAQWNSDEPERLPCKLIDF